MILQWKVPHKDGYIVSSLDLNKLPDAILSPIEVTKLSEGEFLRYVARLITFYDQIELFSERKRSNAHNAALSGSVRKELKRLGNSLFAIINELKHGNSLFGVDSCVENKKKAISNSVTNILYLLSEKEYVYEIK